VRHGAVILGTLLAATAVTQTHAGKAGEVRKQAFKLVNEGVAAYNRADFKAAIVPLQKAAAMSLNSFPAHHYLGLALAGDRRYAEAVEAYKIATRAICRPTSRWATRGLHRVTPTRPSPTTSPR
jgi:Flp pilus assembly protein TadD